MAGKVWIKYIANKRRKWILDGNHIAVDEDNNTIQLQANELLSAFSDNNYPGIRDTFPAIRISKISSEIKCELVSEGNNICLNLYVLRMGKRITVDCVNGVIINHCFSANTFFYVSGCVLELNEMLRTCDVKQNGFLSTAQYIQILQYNFHLDNSLIIDNVNHLITDIAIEHAQPVPVKLKAKLYPYQETGYYWLRFMLRENKGCILGDEMGLGKTLQVITVIQHLKDMGKGPVLVIAPVSLLKNWENEINKFAPDVSCLIHHGSKRTGCYGELQQYDVIVISYATAIGDSSMLRMIQWELVVLDEAQNIKNPASERTKFVKMLPRKSCIAVTGTPFENHVSDIWSLLDFIMPGLFGNASQFTQSVSDDLAGAKKLETMLSPLMLRRRVDEVASDLPQKVYIDQPLIIGEAEAHQYEAYRQEIIINGNGSSFNLGSLQKLRMYCTHPAIADDKTCDIFKSSIKYQRACEIISEIVANGEKVILFTSFTKMFDILKSDITVRFKIPVWTINGTTAVEKRQEIVDLFNNYGGSALLVLNPRAAGTGLNITAANHVIHYNLEWNPAIEDQGTARAYRRGQQKTVFVYRLYYVDTVEETVNDRISKKRALSSAAVIGTDGESANREEIIEALSKSPLKEGR